MPTIQFIQKQLTPERYQQIKAIYQAAEDLPEGEQAAYIAKHCAGDDDLFQAVQQLRVVAGTSDSLLSHGALNLGLNLHADLQACSLVGRKIGIYTVLSELGRGGMGQVYLAVRSDDFEKSVAIKLLPGGPASESLLKRFYLERQILANLDHPNIARLIDGGTADGRPYLVMDYIKGMPIDQFCDEHRLSLHERLRLFLSVCDAVQYAHRNLVVHRDLKPGNILVTADGVPKLLDFGIAKLLSEDVNLLMSVTAADVHPMTPGYASPEQVLGLSITTASDVYSLGVVLYELLTGHRPFHFKTNTISELYQAVLNRREPTRPSEVVRSSEEITTSGQSRLITPEEISRTRSSQPEKLQRSLRGDLDNILLCALNYDAERRYASVDHFSADIHRYLEGRPVSARSATLRYRAAKFVRRNPRLIAAIALFSILLLGGFWATKREARIAEAERARAEIRFADVRGLAHSVIFDLHDAIAVLPGSTKARKLLVDRARAYLDELAKDAAGDVSLQLELATAYAKLGEIQWTRYYSHLGDQEGALRSQTKAFEIRKAVLSAHPDNAQARSGLASSYIAIGDLMIAQGQVRPALDQYRHALQIRSAIAAADPSNVSAQKNLAIAYQRVGDTLGNIGFPNLGDFSGAQVNFEQMQKINLLLAAKQPQNLTFRQDVGIGFEKLARVRQALGDTEGALTLYMQEKDAFASIVAAEPRNLRFVRDLAIGYSDVCEAAAEAKKLDLALPSCNEMLAINRNLASSDLHDAGAHNDLCGALRATAHIAHQAGKHRQAQDLTRELLRLEKEWAERPGATSSDLNALAWDLLTMEEVTSRQPALALEYAKRAAQADQFRDPNILNTLSQAYLQTGDRDRAIQTELQAIKLAGSNPTLHAQLQANLDNLRRVAPSFEPRVHPVLSSQAAQGSPQRVH